MAATQKIYLLGGFRTDPTLNIPGGHPFRLFVYLLLHPQQAHGRDQICERLWPEISPARGRRALSDALYRLRQAVPAHWYHVQSESIIFLAQEELWLDTWAFAENAGRADLTALHTAADLYIGELMPGYEEDWIWLEREQLRIQMITVLQKLAQILEQEQKIEAAESTYRRLAKMEGMNEYAQRGLMRCLAAQGLLREALAAYQQFQTFLAAELSVPPAEETRRLAQQLQEEWEVQQQAASQMKKIPFVGRMAERTQLLDQLDKARGGTGGLMVVLGQAGIGKTRLLEFLAQSADWRGWQVAWGRGEEFALPQPYAPLAAALTSVLPRPRVQQLTHFVPVWWMAILARILPVFRQQPDLPAVPETAVTEKQLSAAMRVLLEGMQEISPCLIILDDVQWADPAVWPLLDALLPALANMSIMIVVSGRVETLQANEAVWETIQMWEKAQVPLLQLGGLQPQPLAEMARALGKPPLNNKELANLHQLSNGNPLLALSLIESAEPMTAVAEPQLLDMQRKRLVALNDASLLVLQAAAILGYRFNYEMWEVVVSGIDEADLPVLAGELERLRLIILEDDGYRFHHDTLRACVYNDCPDARRPFLHQKALAAYEQWQPQATISLLYHAVQSQNETAVVRYALQAGQEALDRFSFKDALTYFTQALDVLPADRWAERFAALAGRATALNVLADYETLKEDLLRLQQIADHLPDLSLKAEVLWRRAGLAWVQGEQESARQLAEEGLALAKEVGDVAREAALLETLARVARNLGDFHLAQEWVTQAFAQYTAVTDQFGQASALDKLANLAYEMGEYEQAKNLHQQAARIFQDLGATPFESRTLSGLALVWKALGQYEKARQTHRQVLAIAREFGDKHAEWVQLVLLGNIDLELGEHDTAVNWYTDALALCAQINNPRYISMTLNNLGEAYRENGEPEPALMYYNEALKVNQEKGYLRGEAHSLHGIGLAQLDKAKLNEAREAFEAARVIWQELGERLKLTETMASLALLALSEGNVAAAQSAIEASLSQIDEEKDHPFWRRWAHYAAYRVRLAEGELETAVNHLCLAKQALTEISSKLPEAKRADFLINVPINRQIEAGLRERAQISRVRLVAADVPLGQKLTASDYMDVSWTISLPTDVRIQNNTERRRHVLQRLLREAKAQGAAPTDADLATAVGVSRRTILRDIKAFTDLGIILPTRRRAS